MAKRSKQIALSDAAAGMVLAEDLLTPRGKLIMPKGAVLTDNTITSLTRYDIDNLIVELSDDASIAEEAAERARQQERIARLFRNSDQDAAALLLKQQVTAFRMGEA